MSDEIKKAQEQAESLGIYEIVRNIATNGGEIVSEGTLHCEWEGCRITFKAQVHGQGMAAWFTSIVTCIVMPDETILYSSVAAAEGKQSITDFRYGSWVERIKAYSEQITARKQQEAEMKTQQIGRAHV